MHQDIFGKENGELVSPNSASSTDKGTTKNPNDQEKNIENAETAQTLAGKVAGAVSKIVDAGSENELQKMNMTTLFKGNAAAAEDMQAPRVFVVTNPK